MSAPPPITSVGLPPAQDRMLTTVFLAALLHGIVILGITFGATSRSSSDDVAAGLEVVLVNDRAPSVAQNPDAQYLSQRTQLGSGNSLKGERSLIPRSSLMAVDRLGIPNGDGLAPVQAGSDAGEEQLIATHGQSVKIVYFAAANEASEASALPVLLEKRPDLAMTPNDDGVQLRMRGESKNRLWIAADTRESDVAVYLDSWRRKIERVGTMNFPDVARRRNLSGTPVIEVTIGANGKLLNASVRRTSGHTEIDEAALRILKLASPYDRFPSELTAKHDEIRIAYEWQFLAGDAQGGSVFYAEPTEPNSP
jgi:periplasmic protein TonB